MAEDFFNRGYCIWVAKDFESSIWKKYHQIKVNLLKTYLIENPIVTLSIYKKQSSEIIECTRIHVDLWVNRVIEKVCEHKVPVIEKLLK